MKIESVLKGTDSEQLAHEVLRIASYLDGEDSRIVRQLWADREYLALRLKIIAEDCETEGDHNSRQEIGRWAREAYEEVM